MRSNARAEDAKRTKALVAAVDTLGPREDLGACPIKVPIVGTDDMTRIRESEPTEAPVDWRSIRADQMMVVPKDELPTATSARLKHKLEMIDFMVSALNASNLANTEKLIRELGDTKNAPWELVIIASKRVDPKLMGGDKFEAGAILGHAYVYDHVTGNVVCAARVLAESSKLLTAGASESTAASEYKLKLDLENEAFRDAAQHLAKAGPLGAEEPAGKPAGG
jgi:hypothetical protein